MIIKFLLIKTFLFFLVSCSLEFDKEIIFHGSNLKSFSKETIAKGVTTKSFIIEKLGPPSFTNPYNSKNVFYISQKMRKEIGKVNQFDSTFFLEIYYNNEDKIEDFTFTNKKLSNQTIISELDDQSIASDRKLFEVFKNIFSNLRRKTEN